MSVARTRCRPGPQNMSSAFSVSFFFFVGYSGSSGGGDDDSKVKTFTADEHMAPTVHCTGRVSPSISYDTTSLSLSLFSVVDVYIHEGIDGIVSPISNRYIYYIIYYRRTFHLSVVFYRGLQQQQAAARTQCMRVSICSSFNNVGCLIRSLPVRRSLLLTVAAIRIYMLYMLAMACGGGVSSNGGCCCSLHPLDCVLQYTYVAYKVSSSSLFLIRCLLLLLLLHFLPIPYSSSI